MWGFWAYKRILILKPEAACPRGALCRVHEQWGVCLWRWGISHHWWSNTETKRLFNQEALLGENSPDKLFKKASLTEPIIEASPSRQSIGKAQVWGWCIKEDSTRWSIMGRETGHCSIKAWDQLFKGWLAQTQGYISIVFPFSFFLKKHFPTYCTLLFWAPNHQIGHLH